MAEMSCGVYLIQSWRPMYRQNDRNGHAFAPVAVQHDSAAVFGYDAQRDRQPQPEAVFVSGKERIEDLVYCVRRNTSATVVDGDSEFLVVDARGYCDLSSTARCLD